MPILQAALRQLRRSPGFSLTVILTLALGIGGTTAMYGILDAVVLRPLPFPQPGQLVALDATPWSSLSLPTLTDYQHRTSAFQSIAAWTGWSPRVESSAGTGHASPLLVSQNFLATLGAPFLLGHNFTPTSSEAVCLHQAIVTSTFWHRLGGTSTLADHTLRLDGATYSVIGVLAPIETGGPLDGSAVLTTLGCDAAKALTDRGDSAFQAIARLRPGVSLRSANAQLATIQAQLLHDFPTSYPPSFAATLQPLADHDLGTSTRSALLASLLACGLLLFIACANLANLLLARNTRRRSEFAVRAALGGTSRHILHQLLVENCTLALLGSALGLALADLLLRAVHQLRAIQLPRLTEAHLAPPVLAFAALTTLLVAVLLTLLPARQTLRSTLLTDLNSGSTRSSGSPSLRRAGRLLVAAQLALALVLVACAGWMVSTVFLLLHQPLGFSPDRLLVAGITLGDPASGNAAAPSAAARAQTLAHLDQVLATLRAVPGIAAASAANDKPLGGRTNQYDFCSDLHPEFCQQPHLRTPDVFQVTPGYFHTLDQLLRRGRDFTPADDGRLHVAIVNSALAAQEWPGQNPIGHRIFSGALQAWATVIGEVDDVHAFSLERAPTPLLYLPEADGPETHLVLTLRSSAPPDTLTEPIRRLLRQDTHLTLNSVQTMPDLIEHHVALRAFFMRLALGFGLLALALATLGTYGLLSYEVSLREREMGIRLALGSPRAAIVTLLLRQESRWIAAGILSGTGIAALAGYLLRAQFFHTGPMSLPVLASAALLLSIPALLAVAIPSRRAALLEPSITLRRD